MGYKRSIDHIGAPHLIKNIWNKQNKRQNNLVQLAAQQTMLLNDCNKMLQKAPEATNCLEFQLSDSD